MQITYGFVLALFLSGAAMSRNPEPGSEEIRSFFAQIDDGQLTKGRFFLVDSVERIERSDFTACAAFGGTLKKEVINYIAKQLDGVRPAVWTNAIFDSANIVTQSYINSEVGKVYWNFRYYKFSIPYFSKDRSYCVLYYEIHCGSLCAERSLRAYKKVNGKWKFLNILFGEVS